MLCFLDPSSAGPAGSPATHPAHDPVDLVAARELGRALLWNGEPSRALEALDPVHRARPWDREVQHLMLHALAALGRTVADYAWSLEPEVVRLGPALLEELAELLRRDGGPVTALDLMLAVAERGHPTFTTRELVAALGADPGFRIHRDGREELAPECAVITAIPHPRHPDR